MNSYLQLPKNNVDVNLNPRKHNILNSERENYKQQLPEINEILQHLIISECDYYEALSISSDTNFEIHLKHMPNVCFINNYFMEGLKSWKVN